MHAVTHPSPYSPHPLSPPGALDAAGIPHQRASSAMFSWIDLRAGLRTRDWAGEQELWEEMCEKGGVLLTPGEYVWAHSACMSIAVCWRASGSSGPCFLPTPRVCGVCVVWGVGGSTCLRCTAHAPVPSVLFPAAAARPRLGVPRVGAGLLPRLLGLGPRGSPASHGGPYCGPAQGEGGCCCCCCWGKTVKGCMCQIWGEGGGGGNNGAAVRDVQGQLRGTSGSGGEREDGGGQLGWDVGWYVDLFTRQQLHRKAVVMFVEAMCER